MPLPVQCPGVTKSWQEQGQLLERGRAPGAATALCHVPKRRNPSQDTSVQLYSITLQGRRVGK